MWMYYYVLVTKTVPSLVMIRRLGLYVHNQYTFWVLAGFFPSFLPCKALHGLGRGLDIISTTISYVSFDARDGDGSRYRAGRRKGSAVRDSSRTRVVFSSSPKKK